MSFAFNTRLEQNDYFLELGAGFLLPSESSSRTIGGFLAHLGASYYLSHTSVSPYAGAGLSPRLFLGRYEGGGMALNAHVGLMFMRESSTRLYVELQVDQNLIPVRPDSSDYIYDGYGNSIDPRKVLPTEFSFAAGIGF